VSKIHEDAAQRSRCTSCGDTSARDRPRTAVHRQIKQAGGFRQLLLRGIDKVTS
jgi:hypothetical protein